MDRNALQMLLKKGSGATLIFVQDFFALDPFIPVWERELNVLVAEMFLSARATYFLSAGVDSGFTSWLSKFVHASRNISKQDPSSLQYMPLHMCGHTHSDDSSVSVSFRLPPTIPFADWNVTALVSGLLIDSRYALRASIQKDFNIILDTIHYIDLDTSVFVGILHDRMDVHVNISMNLKHVMKPLANTRTHISHILRVEVLDVDPSLDDDDNMLAKLSRQGNPDSIHRVLYVYEYV